MNATDRKYFLKRALLHSLNDGGGFPVPQVALFASVGIKAEHLQPQEQELKEILLGAQTDGLVIVKHTERGHLFFLGLLGEQWIAKNP